VLYNLQYWDNPAYQETERDVPNCTAENSTYPKMQICLMQNTGRMAQENLREVNYVSDANKEPTTKFLTAITGK